MMENAALSDALAQVSKLAEDNARLRADLSEQRRTQIRLREANRELEWRCLLTNDTNAAAAPREEWREMEERLQLLITENGLLEEAARQAREAMQLEKAASLELRASHARATGELRRAQGAQAAAEDALRAERSRARDAHEAQQELASAASAEATATAHLRAELQAARQDAARAHRESAEMRARLEAAASETALERDGTSARDATLEAQRAELARQLAETRSHLDHSEAAARELREGGSAAAAEVGSLRERLRQAEEQIAAAGREKARAHARAHTAHIPPSSTTPGSAFRCLAGAAAAVPVARA